MSDHPEEKEDNLNATDDRKTSQEAHGSPNETKCCSELDFLIPLYLVKGGRVKVNLDQL